MIREIKIEFDLPTRDVDAGRYPIVIEGDIFKKFMSHSTVSLVT